MNGEPLNQHIPQRTPSKFVSQAFSFLNSYETDLADIDNKPKLIEDCDENSEYRIETYVDHEEDVRRTTSNGLERKLDNPTGNGLERKVDDNKSEALEDWKKSKDEMAFDVKDGSVLIKVSGVSLKSKSVIEEDDLTTGTSQNKIKPKEMKTGTSKQRNAPRDDLPYKINPVYEVAEDEHVDNESTGDVDGVEKNANGVEKNSNDSLKPSIGKNNDASVELEKYQNESAITTSCVEEPKNADGDDDVLEKEACIVVKAEANMSMATEFEQIGRSLQYKTEDCDAHLKEDIAAVTVEEEVVELRKSLSPHDRISRQPTWKVNQHVVSEAFQFLAIEEGDANTDSLFTDSIDFNGLQPFGEKTDACQSSDPSAVRIAERPSVEVIVEDFCENGGLKESNDNDDGGDYKQESKDKVGKLQERRRPGKKKTKSVDDDDDGSSDEDKGVYRESFRNSKWLYVGEVEHNGMLTDEGPDTDAVFPEDSFDAALSPLTPTHKRNISTSTTASEMAFRNHYSSINKRIVKRADSQEEYKRYTTTAYDNVKVLKIERDSQTEFGIHVLDCKPAIISGVDKGSPAEKVGLKEGQVLIAINGVNVLELNHQAIVDLVHRDSRTLTVEVGNADLTNIIDLQEPVKSGSLHKQTTSLFKSWKKRYFILRKDSCLYYYKNDQETDPLGAIPLNGYVVTRYGDLNKFGFKADKFNSRTMRFSADSRADMTSWVEAMNNAAKQDVNQDPWLDVTAQNVGLPALSIKNADCCGNLQKMTRTTRRWRKRYCVLKDACIYYYKDCKSRQADGVAHLHGYKVDGGDAGGKKYSFSLIPPEPQMRRFNFCTDNDTDKLRWIRAFNNSIKKWVKVE
ncbi:uncharacterized protein LOC127872880 [Dreissena polymorpha]|nr:uncharacterized protein LOC127872880 [Dreissena polymorpha]XP_052272303.1 uncharacterized protein LOC127872880 [Dreissena polymorpha]XP_052272304.1 uncharacterized protein LOC127872880 [Dreissena polymorpha]